MRAAILAATAAAVVLAVGCGREVPRGRIHGTVTYQGKPFPGTVIFLATDNKTHLAELKPDGSYDVTGVALGPIKVSVQQPAPRYAVKGEFDVPSASKGVKDEKAGKSAAQYDPQPKPSGPRVPAQYADSNNSGLDFELKSADQNWSVDLK
jgi:hypothetical protein